MVVGRLIILVIFFNFSILILFFNIEFLAATMEKNIYMKEEKLYMAFKMFDLDGSGKISANELK